MSKLPKLKVRRVWHPVEEILDFEQAKYLPYLDFLIFVEGRRVNSYEELTQLVADERYQEKELLEVVLLNMELVGGG